MGSFTSRLTARITSFSAPGFTFISAMIILIALCYFFPPFWESNDDVGMAMVAQGYGAAAYSSPNLVYSNVLWGYLAASLPTISGVGGYSWLALTTLFVVAWSLLYFLDTLAINRFFTLGIVLLVMVRAVCFPQFTITAGLLAVSAVVGWLAYAKTRSLFILWLVMFLGFAGFLVRHEEFWFVLLVALPLLPWQVLGKNKNFLLSVVGLVASTLVATVIDRQSYQSTSWQAFQQFEPVRAQFTDYDVGHTLKSKPELLERSSLSTNDLSLLSSWFYADPVIADTRRLEALLNEAGLPSHVFSHRQLALGWDALTSLTSITLLPLEILLLTLFFLTKHRWKIIAATGLFLLAIFVLGVLGRPSVLRIYYPVVALLALSPLWLGYTASITKQRWIAISVIVACGMTFAQIIPEHRTVSAFHTRVQKDEALLQANQDKFPYYVTWAQFFPYEYAYPLLQAQTGLHFYALDSFAKAPFSRSLNEEIAGRGLVKQLLSSTPVPIIARNYHYQLLTSWCQERYQKSLSVQPVSGLSTFKMALVSCN